MSFKLRKCVSLGGIGSIEADPPSVTVSDFAFLDNAGDSVRTHTGWVRLFAQWDFFAPYPTSLNNPNDPQSPRCRRGSTLTSRRPRRVGAT